MNKRFLAVVAGIFLVASAAAQVSLRISQIQPASGPSPYQNQYVTTFGVVTAMFRNAGEIGGFFIQDTARNVNDSISDGLFIYSSSFSDVAVGDWVEVTGTVTEYSGMTQISGVSAISRKASNYALPFVTMKFPSEWTDWKRLTGMLVRFDQRLIVNMSRNALYNGQIGLSSIRRRAETEYFIRRGDEIPAYDSLYAYNSNDYVILASGRTGTQPGIPFANEMGILRTGQGIDTLWAIVYQTSANQYMLLPAQKPVLEGDRPTVPDAQKLGQASLKICAYNLENYYGQGITANKTKKVVNGLVAIDADIFGFCETQQGDQTVDALVSALNAALGRDVYTNYKFGLANNATYSGVSIIYKKDKVRPNGTPWYINTSTIYYRKYFVSFEEISTGEKFMISLNHFKSKSGTGTGDDADNGDGQSDFNATRITEADAVVAYYNNTAKSRYGTERLIVMGDLNAMTNEDPIRILKNAGFVNQNERFSTEEYSYVYDNKIQYLDYVMVNDSLAEYVTGATVFHINTDELLQYESDTTMYRCSDHDPVILGLRFSDDPPASLKRQAVETFALSPNPSYGHVQIHSENLRFRVIQVFDGLGREIYSETLSQPAHHHEIRLHKAQGGYHFVRLITENGQILTQKCLIEK